MNKQEVLPDRINDLICFALYSANNAMNRAYKPLLAELGLTYPQYITLTALWQEDKITVGRLCDRLLLETNTLTPILKRLEVQGHIKRIRDKKDERRVFITLTASGKALKKKAPKITECIVGDTQIPLPELSQLVETIKELRGNMMKGKAPKN